MPQLFVLEAFVGVSLLSCREQLIFSASQCEKEKHLFIITFSALKYFYMFFRGFSSPHRVFHWEVEIRRRNKFKTPIILCEYPWIITKFYLLVDSTIPRRGYCLWIAVRYKEVRMPYAARPRTVLIRKDKKAKMQQEPETEEAHSEGSEKKSSNSQRRSKKRRLKEIKDSSCCTIL